MATTFLGVAVFFINREVAERRRAERELQTRTTSWRRGSRTHGGAEKNQRRPQRRDRRTQAQRGALAISLEHIEKTRDDLQFMFAQLRLVTAIIDGNGRITFLSKNARILFDNVNSDLVGGHWEEVLLIDDDTRRPSKPCRGCRASSDPQPHGHGGSRRHRYSTEIEIVDDPRGDISDRRRYLGGAAGFEHDRQE
jgi:PAS domain-containing protein